MGKVKRVKRRAGLPVRQGRFIMGSKVVPPSSIKFHGVIGCWNVISMPDEEVGRVRVIMMRVGS